MEVPLYNILYTWPCVVKSKASLETAARCLYHPGVDVITRILECIDNVDE